MKLKNILLYVLFAQTTQFFYLQAAIPTWFKKQFLSPAGAQLGIDILKSGSQLPGLKNVFQPDPQTELNFKDGKIQCMSHDMQFLECLDRISKDPFYKALPIYDRVMACKISFLVASKTRTAIGMPQQR